MFNILRERVRIELTSPLITGTTVLKTARGTSRLSIPNYLCR